MLRAESPKVSLADEKDSRHPRRGESRRIKFVHVRETESSGNIAADPKSLRRVGVHPD
jgi:hypothetical protein